MFRKLAIGGLISAAFFVPVINASASPTGNTCTARESGTGAVLNIDIPPGAPGQGGFAFGGPGITIVNITIHNYSGTTSKAGLPANTSLEILLSNQLAPGPIVVDITASGPFTGPFNVVPANFPPSMYFDSFSCPFGGTMVPNNVFTVEPRAVYDATTNRWYVTTDVPGPGTLWFSDPPQRSVSSLAATAATPLVKSGKVVATKAGKVKLTLVPTAAGKAALAKSGSLKVPLKITFTPTGGKAATKTVTFTLRKK